MGKRVLIIGLLVLAFALPAAWQIAVCEFANIQLRDDLKDLASQGGTRIGLLPPKSDADLRDAVVAKARSHDILLQPEQVSVERRDSGGDFQILYITADYKQRVKLPGFSFELHFTPASS